MEYILVPSNRNASNEDLINDLIAVSKRLGKKEITRNEYNIDGKYCEGTLRKRFGSWSKALEVAGLSSVYSYDISKDEIVEELKRIAQEISTSTITISDFDAHKQISSVDKIRKLFGTWENALKEAGLDISSNYHKKYSEKELFENLMKVWIFLNRQPKLGELDIAPSEIGRGSYKRTYGSWSRALEIFIKYLNTKEIDAKYTGNEELMQNSKNEESYLQRKSVIHKTQRNVNLRLRFQILQRDKFSCVICGRSPAKDSSIILHVDHIIPWSEGGETIEDNLRTLCSKCNLGKSDLF